MAFKKGESGNPAGRKKGSAKIEPLRTGLIEHVPEILNKLVIQAKAGDIQACKLILERVLPPLKSQASAVEIPVSETLAQQGGEIIKATMVGQIPPDIGSMLITALANQGKLVELQEMTERLERIEKQLEQR
jgi:hypothetical protein